MMLWTRKTIFGQRHAAIFISLVIGCASLDCTILYSAPHEGHEEKKSADASGDAKPIGTGLVLPNIDGPKPWSDKPALTDADRFSIAIMTDRTGGHRPGIWMQAVERINWLRPDFVVSVGDLIEGYTEDDQEIARQWTEFLGFIDQMQMKFFFVPGNHDVTNPKLHAIWKERFGREWYSFDYKGVHFVCLNSEDPTAHVGDEQLAWLSNDLKANEQARWTLVFLHKPIWTYSERDLQAGNPDSSNWSKVSELLGGRPHTVFAGHVHHYVQYDRGGRDYYSLATTGGSSPLRGVAYGEFDHITWLTMEKDGPRVANLLLDGIQPANVVTEKSIERFREFLQLARINVEPIFISGTEIQTGEINIRLRNEFDRSVKLRGKIDGLPLVGLSMETQLLELSADAGEAISQTIRFELKEPVDLQRFKATSMTAIVESDDVPPLRAEWTIPVVIDREYQLARASIAVDGQLSDWSKSEWWSTGNTPVLAGAIQNWTGAGDCSFQVSMSYDDDHLYVAARVADEQVVVADSITLLVDPRLQLDRLNATSLGRETVAVTINAPESEEVKNCTVFGQRQRPLPGVVAMGMKTQDGYVVEVSLPIKSVIDVQGEDWSSLQFGVRVLDVDAVGEQVEVLWRSGESPRDNQPMAHLLRK